MSHVRKQEIDKMNQEIKEELDKIETYIQTIEYELFVVCERAIFLLVYI